MERTRMTRKEWLALGQKLFGDNMLEWRFECPRCHHLQRAEDFRGLVGAEPDCARRECIGRYKPNAGSAFSSDGPGPCDYTAYGLIRLSPLVIVADDGHECESFGFAPLEAETEGGQ